MVGLTTPAQPECPPFHLNLARAVKRDYIDCADPSTAIFLRAYAFGYVVETVPATLRLTFDVIDLKGAKKVPLLSSKKRLVRILRNAFGKHGLALFFSVALGGSKWLERVISPIIRRLYALNRREFEKAESEVSAVSSENATHVRLNRWSTFISSFLAGCLAFSLQNRAIGRKATKTAVGTLPLVSLPTTSQDTHNLDRHDRYFSRQRYESSTLDLTLFLFVRAIDTSLRAKWANITPSPYSISDLLFKQGDTLLFVLSSWTIMWHWFYKPWLLPPTYNRWIDSLARIDKRLIELLRYARRGEWVYGETPTTPAARAIGPELCTAMGWPAEAGMPNLLTTFPCEVVHGKLGNTASCTVNILKRWTAAWKQSLQLYLPVHLIPIVIFSYRRLLRTPSLIVKPLLGAARSASFLATFVALAWTGICTGRTLIGPRLPFPQQLWDSGLAMSLSTFICGWSVLLENKRRRSEMALFVAPRALYTVIDKVLPSKLLRNQGFKLARELERIVFSLSAATIITFQVYRPEHIRGFVRSMAKYLVGNWGDVVKQLDRL